MKPLLPVVLICIFCLSVTSAQAGVSPCMQKGGRMRADGKCLLTIDAQVSVDYPLDLAANDLVAQTIDPFIKSSKDEFMRTVGTNFIPAPGPYKLDITYETTKHSDEVFTLVFTVYEFTGWANGSTNIFTYTFDTTNNKILALDDLFTDTKAALEIIRPMVQSIVKADVGTMNQQDLLDDGTAIDPQNYQAFSLDADSITFYFSPYQVALYEAGVQKATIPLAKLTSVLKPEFAS